MYEPFYLKRWAESLRKRDGFKDKGEGPGLEPTDWPQVILGLGLNANGIRSKQGFRPK